ncbi:HAD family hydrolase [Prevotella sp. OH937_COT-195]|uniref:HAD family hydrolase n=1 Tax=Prevotella sp. OH937_COT-195 TaxID=2491051 RepID=UPI000F64F8F4|nr:HAD-IA family hydrolase [Prevotella sp. OH937_COT-195]RRD02928.1 HAD family hydrolase [Prevotella sp. OH937_COT-195]
MPDFFIFDLDGTLLYSLGDLAASTNHALRTCGMPEHSVDDIRRFVGNGVKMLMVRAVPDGEANPCFEEAFSAFRKHYMEHCFDTTKPYDGIMDMLYQLKARGKSMAIVSNKMQEAVEELRRRFFAEYIDVAIGESRRIRKKPAPDAVFEALRLLGCDDRSRALYIGDSDVDIETARASGLRCASVLWGFRDRQFLMEHGADSFINRPDELLSL